MKERIQLLNLGCGTRYLQHWVNVDFTVTGPLVIAHNLLDAIPFTDNAFYVVYHSHVLEHFSKEQAVAFIKECYRVLKPGGIIRIAVPDLETIAREYLKNLDAAVTGNAEASFDYEWTMLEMYDQAVRNQPGGSMAKYWWQSIINNEAYISQRLGDEFTSVRKRIKENNLPFPQQQEKTTIKEKIIARIAGDKKAPMYLKLGKFRMGGEIHQWMYDRFSLGKLLQECGFKHVKKTDAFTSAIPDWETNQWLDIENGAVRKPDSLFMEAQK